MAIPGLIEEPVQTWIHPQTGHFWLSESLPTEFISARIFMFNYPSYSLLSDEEVNIDLYAEKLLSDLKTVEAGKDNRKLVFIAHSYGGFLAEKALVLANNDVRYSDIVRNTLVLCFFGTPDYFQPKYDTPFQPPFDLEDLGDLYWKGRARSSLVDILKTNTGNLPELTDALKKRAISGSVHPADVINFCERDATASLGRKASVVTKSLSSYRLT